MNGYTDLIANSKTPVNLRRFAYGCLSAFDFRFYRGELNSNDPAILEDFPLPTLDIAYDTAQLKEAQKKRARIAKASDRALYKQALKGHQNRVASCETTIAERKELRFKYESLLDQARAWPAPTESHENFKKFMVDQLEWGLNVDCDIGYYEEQLKKSAPTPDSIIVTAYRTELINDVNSDIAYHVKRIKEDRERYKENLTWIKAIKRTFKSKHVRKNLTKTS